MNKNITSGNSSTEQASRSRLVWESETPPDSGPDPHEPGAVNKADITDFINICSHLLSYLH